MINKCWLLLFVCLFLGACQTTPPGPTPEEIKAQENRDQLLALIDPCALRLGDIADALLMYYSRNKTMPATLEELQASAPTRIKLNLSCPVSHQWYTYQPTVLYGPGPERRLIAFDPIPSHDGRRWAIVAMPSRPTQPVKMWVVALDNKTFAVMQSAPVVPTNSPVTPTPAPTTDVQH